ncbi:MAG: hypothetical protein PHO56_00155 [Patescibacteria group bacterium]|nr:hypothetical protein [Patescibacteria group bacterium]
MIKQRDIIKSLIFLDIFDYPLTAMEIWRFLPVRAELGETVNILSSFVIPTEARLARSGGIPFVPPESAIGEKRDPSASAAAAYARDDKEKNGFYFLSGREELIEKRREFVSLAESKFKIAKRAAWLLHFIPGVKMIALCNNFYYRPESDIDFFIVLEQGRMWLGRALVTAALHLFRLRRHGKKIANRICLSFYITEDNLNLEKIALKSAKDGEPAAVADPYLAYWLAFLKPIYGQECYDLFWQANVWLNNYFPNILPIVANQTKIVKDNRLAALEKKINSWWFDSFIGACLETLARKIQMKKMSGRRSGPGVIIADNILKFHENDRREFFREEFNNRILKSQI